MKPFDLLTLGEVLYRLSPPGMERLSACDTLIRRVGGAELNVAVGAAELGLKSGLITKLPAGTAGAYARHEIRANALSECYIAEDHSRDARLGIYYMEAGAAPRKPAVIYDRKYSSIYTISPEDFPEEMYHAARCFLTTGITLALGGAVRETAVEMIRRFKAGGARIAFDVNFRGNLWSGAEAKACIEQLLPLVDIFFCSESTARLTFGLSGTTEQMMKQFTEQYPIQMVVSTIRTVHSPKVHDFGSVLYDSETDRYYCAKPYTSIDVADRIGSGDAYIAGCLYGLLKEDGNPADAVRYGNAFAALKCTVEGDLPDSSLEETVEVIRTHESDGPETEMKR